MVDPFHEGRVTFAGGEASPEMYSRIDLAKYSTFMKTARNGFVHPQGGFSNRSGFRYVAKAKYSDRNCRLIPFEFSDTASYMLEVGDFYMRFYVNGAQILFGGLPYEIVTPYAVADLPLIKYTQSANTLYLAHPNYAPQTLLRVSDTNWTLAAFPFVNGPWRDENSTPTTLTYFPASLSAPGSTDVINASAALFASARAGDLWRIDYAVPTQSYVSSVGSPGVPGGNFIATSRDYNIATTGTWTGSFVIEKSTDGSTWKAISQVFVSGATNFNVNGDAGEPCFVRINFLTLSAGSCNVSLSSNGFSYTSVFSIISVINSSQVYVNNLSINPWFGAVGGIYATTQTTWFEGAWSSFRGWPSAVTFYQDRLGWASTPDNPLGNWWSQTGNYVDYGVSDPLVDSDAISVNFPTRKVNQCQHLLPMYVVLALTSSGEISIGPGGSGDFTPTSIDLRPQTYHGANSCPPVLVGNQAVYVQARSAQVRSIAYQYFTNIFTGEILNLYSTHLFINYTLLDMTYAESPDAQIYAVRSDGTLLCFTYLPEQQVMAWTHWDTLGSFVSCSVIPAATYDELWVVVNRAAGYFIERLAQRLPTSDTKDQFHVDCGITYSGAPTTTISGLNFLGQSQIFGIVPDVGTGNLAIEVYGHNLTYGQNVTVSGLTILTALNGNTYKVASLIHAGIYDILYLADIATGAIITGGSSEFPANAFLNGGQSVMVLGDGNVYGPITVVGDTITLPQAVSIAHVGLPYVMDHETMNIERAGQDGTSQDRKTRVVAATYRFKDSLGGYIGPDADHLHPIVPAPPAVVGYQPLFTGDSARIPIFPDWNSNGRIFFRQTDPLPVTITGVFPITEGGNL